MLVDTDVLIWHLRGYPQATRRLVELGALALSAVSYLEVLQGMRDKAELVAVKKMLQLRAATLLPVSEAITQRAIELMEAITLSHGCRWATRSSPPPRLIKGCRCSPPMSSTSGQSRD